MRIVEISIEGFKSYGDRVKLGPFGPRFTAICGPNGSGKSNCFDSICFAMGFRVGADMRADNLSDLIYQRGQSGVCSASVTITFDNSDKHFSPALYSECSTIRVSRQIALRGRDRFFVNGELRRMTDIEKLFKEAKLNIRAPHQFVIMQGKIQEIVRNCSKGQLLPYLEDCVGTSLFDKEKEKSERILGEKNCQLKSMDHDLSTLLQPALDKAKDARANYLKWLESGKEILLLKVLYSEAKLIRLRNLHSNHLSDLDKIRSQDNEGKEKIRLWIENLKRLESEIKLASQEIENMNSKINSSSLDWEKCQALRTTVVKMSEELKLKISTRKQRLNEIKKLTLKSKGFEDELIRFQSNNQEFVKEEESVKEEISFANTELKSIISKVDAARSGVWLDDQGSDLSVQISELKSEENILRSKLNTDQIELNHNESELSRLSKIVVADKGELKETVEKIEHWKSVKMSSEKKLEELKLDRNEEQILGKKLQELRRTEENLSERLRNLNQRFNREEKIRSKFNDLNKVPGVLMDIFRPKNMRWNLALEEAAKTRLFHVVVDNDDTATELFQWASNHGVRVTCLPINRINNQPASANVISRAKEQGDSGGASEIHYALEIIDYDQKFTQCLASALNVFVTDSKETARRINRLEKWVHNTLTEEGDSYNPTGQISGGSKAGMNNLLRDRAEYLTREKDYKECVAEREECGRRLNYFLSKAQNHKELCCLITQASQKLESLEVQLDLLRDSTDEGRKQKAEEEVARLRKEIEGSEDKLKVVVGKLKPMTEMFNACAKNAEAAVKRLIKQQLEAERRQGEAEAKYQKLLNDREAIIKQHAELKMQLETLGKTINEMTKECEMVLAPEIEALTKESAHVTEEYENLAAKNAAKEKAREDAINTHKKLEEERDSINAEIQLEREAAEERARLRHRAEADHNKLLYNVQESEKELKEAERNAGSDFDGLKVLRESYMMNDGDMLGKISEDLAARTKERAALQMRLDKKCIDSLGQIESEFNALRTSRQKVEKEREAVIELIENIEQQKLKKLQTSFQRVNQYFSNIFSTLLPEANAYMINNAPDFSKGLELAVEFNGIKKTGLIDLSGGQRSLLALSLLLAMLKLNPCPFYVFDEVDAALDSGHTQNLGLVIREYFGESQFLVVSHRENFYSNAEVIFRTSCVNGKSHIIRNVNSAR